MHTNMRVVRGKLKIGLGPCHKCHGHGTVYKVEEVPCRGCWGRGEILVSGRRAFAHMRTCGKCHGAKVVTKTRTDKEVRCPRCRGVNSAKFEQGQRTDTVHSRILERIPHRVYRVTKAAYAGSASGYVDFDRFACFRSRVSTLYGSGEDRRHTKDLLEGHRVGFASACQISKEDGTLCDHMGIFVAKNQVVVAPVFSGDTLPEFVVLR